MHDSRVEELAMAYRRIQAGAVVPRPLHVPEHLKMTLDGISVRGRRPWG